MDFFLLLFVTHPSNNFPMLRNPLLPSSFVDFIVSFMPSTSNSILPIFCFSVLTSYTPDSIFNRCSPFAACASLRLTSFNPFYTTLKRSFCSISRHMTQNTITFKLHNISAEKSKALEDNISCVKYPDAFQ